MSVGTKYEKTSTRSSFTSEDGSDMYSVISEAFHDEITVSATDKNQIGGYLLKKSADGAWQKRYFETNQNFLTYYKSKKMTKLLAALNLADVGDITLIGKINDSIGEGTVFQLELKTKNYILRTRNIAEATKWMDTLRTIRDQAKSNTILEEKEELGNSKNGKLDIVMNALTTSVEVTPKQADTNKLETVKNIAAPEQSKKGCCIVS